MNDLRQGEDAVVFRVEIDQFKYSALPMMVYGIDINVVDSTLRYRRDPFIYFTIHKCVESTTIGATR